MKQILLIVLSVLGFLGCVCSAEGAEPKAVLRDDCHLSFLPPANLEYIEVDDAITIGRDLCYIAFKYSGDMRIKSSVLSPAVPEDWRAMTDFALTVRSIPLDENLAKIEAIDGAQQNGLFELCSKKHISLQGGDLYVLKYLALNSKSNLIKFNQSTEVVFVAGNGSQSLSFVLYSGRKMSHIDREKTKSLWICFHLSSLIVDFYPSLESRGKLK